MKEFEREVNYLLDIQELRRHLVKTLKQGRGQRRTSADASDVQPFADVWCELTPSDRFRNRQKPRPVSNIVVILKPGAFRKLADPDYCPMARCLPPSLLRKRERKALAKSTEPLPLEERANILLELSSPLGDCAHKVAKEEQMYHEKLLSHYRQIDYEN